MSSSWKEESNSGFGVFGGVSFGLNNQKQNSVDKSSLFATLLTYDPEGVFLPEINADEMGETLEDDLLDSLCASRNILK